MTIEVRGVCALLQVFDMPTSIRFYRDVLGFEILETSAADGDQFGGADSNFKRPYRRAAVTGSAADRKVSGGAPR